MPRFCGLFLLLCAVSALAQSGSIFDGWSNCGVSTHCGLTMDQNKSVIASLSLGSTFSQSNRPPANWYPYPQNSVWTQPIPSNATSHDITNSAAMVLCALTCGGRNLSSPGNSDGSAAFLAHINSAASDGSPGQEDSGIPVYYCPGPNCVYYRVHGSDCYYETFIDMRIKVPNQAQRTGKSFTLPDGSDGSLGIYDQDNGILARFMSGGGCTTSGCVSTLPNSTATTPQTALDLQGLGVEGSSCLGSRPNAETDTTVAQRNWTSPAGISYTLGGSGDNLGAGNVASLGLLRIEEFGIDVNGVVGTINRMFSSSMGCVSGAYIYPAISDAEQCSLHGISGAYPPNGALLYCDYTDAQIDAMLLPPFQNTILHGLCRHGTFPTVTYGDNRGTDPMSVNDVESELAYFKEKGKHHPLFVWLQGQKLGSPLCNTGGAYAGRCPAQATITGGGNSMPHSEYRFNINPLYGIPPTGSGDTGNFPAYIYAHFHFPDPCVIKRMVNDAAGKTVVSGECRS